MRTKNYSYVASEYSAQRLFGFKQLVVLVESRILKHSVEEHKKN